MGDALPEVFKTLADETIELVNEIPIDPKKRAENLRILIKNKNKINDLIVGNVLYQKQVKLLIEGFKEIKALSDSYYSTLIDGYVAKNELYTAIMEANITVTKDLLLGAGIRDNIGNAITEVLKANTNGVTNRTALNKILRQFIEGGPNEVAYLNRYVKLTTMDSVMTFSREYNSTVANDLNLQYYYYAGTLIEDSRPFCSARAGRYFKKSEVESWANLGKWDGRKPGTNKNTIFSYAGGWGCRHEIYPVTKTQYTVAQKRGKAGLK